MFLKHTRWAMLWALLILVLCGMPGKDIPHISFLELLSFDKFVHAGIFFVQFLVLARGLVLQTDVKLFQDSPKVTSLLFCIVYGGALEIMQQTLFEDRSASLYDFVANGFGALVGFYFYDKLENRFLKNLIK